MRFLILSLGLAWALAGCKSSSGFSGGTKQSTGSDATVGKTGSGSKTHTSSGTATKTATSKDVGANEWATLTDASTDTETGTGTTTLPPEDGPKTTPKPGGEVEGHPIGTTCDQCYQLAVRESQKVGFTASKQFIHNFGPNIFQAAPQLCDIHWRSPNGPQEVFTACDCNCVNP